jgi:hypothetical protein
MPYEKHPHHTVAGNFALRFMASCRNKASIPSKQSIDQLNLKRGELISCGATDKQFGIVDFEMSCDKKLSRI